MQVVDRADKEGADLLDRLARLERYERRALTQRRFAIRDFVAAARQSQCALTSCIDSIVSKRSQESEGHQ
jgi:hypothetical protein